MVRAPHGWGAIQAFYGWRADLYLHNLDAWERRMVLVPAPAGQKFTYDGKATRGVRVHGAIAEELRLALREIAALGLWRYVEATGGGYNFRTQRGSNKLSMHSLGAALDVDPANNALGVPPEKTVLGTHGRGVVEVFESRGWTWGGRWGRPDAQHFQFGGGY